MGVCVCVCVRGADIWMIDMKNKVTIDLYCQQESCRTARSNNETKKNNQDTENGKMELSLWAGNEIHS